MAVQSGRSAVGGPSGVCNASVRVKDLSEVWFALLNQLLQLGDLADLLEEKHLSGLVAIDTYSRRVVATVFLAGETVAEDLTDRLPVLDQTTLANCIRHAGASQHADVKLANAAIQQGPTSRRASRRVLCNVGVNRALGLKVTAQM